MRTKTLLLTAGALLAAGLISSQAQPVYSANIVGYATVPTPQAGANYLLSIPFNIGASNGVNEIFGNNLPAGSSVLIWNQGTLNYDRYVYDNSDPIGLGTNVVWYNGDESAAVPPPSLSVGQGFFLVPNAPTTNVFAGTVAINVGTSNKMVLANSGVNYLVGCVVPYAGSVTNGTASGGGPNLNNLPAGSSVLIWNQSTLNYVRYVYDNTDPIGLGTNVVWYNGDESAAVAPPNIAVGQGFFIVPNGPYTWTTGL